MRLAVEHNLHQTKHAERPAPSRTSDLNAVPDLERADSHDARCAWREIHDAEVELPLGAGAPRPRGPELPLATSAVTFPSAGATVTATAAAGLPRAR
jgi:hypothetical protein